MLSPLAIFAKAEPMAPKPTMPMVLPDNSTMQGTVSEMSSVPYSLEEVSEILEKDWIIDQLVDSSYVYQLKVDTETETSQNIIVQASIVTSEVKPIQYVLN